MSIGIFDSGVGGLTVLKEIKNILPNEEIHYFADTARLPYGDKEKEEIVEYSREIINFLLKKNVNIIVMACNTATSLALDIVKKEYDIPIIGVIESGVNSVIANKYSKVGIIATNGTIKSNKYKNEIHNRKENIIVYSKACPKLVPMIENKLLIGEEIENTIKMYMDDIADKIEALVLGCTHYPIIKDTINNIYPHIYIIDPAIELAKNVKNIMLNNNLLDKNNAKTYYYASNNIEKFKKFAEFFLNEDIDNVEMIKLEKEDKYV